MTENLKDMSLTVCVCVSNCMSLSFTRGALSKCSHLTGIKWTEASADDEDLSAKLRASDVVVSEAPVIGKHFDDLKQVKWVHSIWAGVNEVVDKHSPPPFIFTRQVGAYGPLIAEYTIAQIINRERGFLRSYQNQLDCKWENPVMGAPLRMLSSLTVGILGVGEIGVKVAETCKAFGMTVWGLTRTEPVTKCSHVDHYRLIDGLPELLSNSDYVCNILPSTPETAGFLNGDTLKACSKKKSVLINVGRGDVVSEPVLVKAIREGWLGGAILDVFEKEPLSVDSELWKMPEVIITPHIGAPFVLEDGVDVFAKNLQLFIEGKELNYVVDWKRGY